MTYDNILNQIKQEIPFAFTRWGDGEWLNVNGANGANCDGNIYYKDLGIELKSIASTPQKYNLACQTGNKISVDSSKIYPQEWSDADVIHYASIDGNLDDLFSTLTQKRVVYIGNESLRNLKFTNEFIEIPYKNCWNDWEVILNNIKCTLNDKFKVYCFSAGMASNVFIDRLWKSDPTNVYLDVGSVFDPYVGRNTRKYHKNLKLFE